MSWWQRFSGRLEDELDAFAREGFPVQVDEPQKARGRIHLRMVIDLPEIGPTPLLVVYPDTYPHTRPAVYAPSLNLKRHQSPFGGNLCVAPRGSEHWRHDMRAVDLVTRVPELVRLVVKGGDELKAAEEPQGEPVSSYYKYCPRGGIVIPEAALDIPTNVKGGRFSIKFHRSPDWIRIDAPAHSQLGCGLLSEVSSSVGLPLARADDALASAFTGPRWNGRWIRLEAPFRTDSPRDFGAALVGALGGERLFKKFAGPNGFDHGGGSARIAAAVFREEVQQGVFADAWIFYLEHEAKGQRTRVDLLRAMRFSPTQLQSRIPELKLLPKKTASIFGLGSLGAPVALELAKSQIGEVRIADFDFADPAASVRWVQGLDNSGSNKVLHIADAIRRNYPYTSVVPVSLRVGDAPPVVNDDYLPEDTAFDLLLRGSAVVIDATAEENVSYAVAYRATELGLPQIYVWSVDGFGGVVARIRPGVTGCFDCLLNALSPEGGAIPAPSFAADPALRRIQPRGCADPTFAAAGVDLLPLVPEATRLALSVLAGGPPDGYPAIPRDVFVLDLRDRDGKIEGPPRWRGYKLPQRSGCLLCSLAPK